MSYRKHVRKEYAAKRSFRSIKRRGRFPRERRRQQNLRMPENRIFYHVTTIEDLDEIMKEGLVPYESYEETEERSPIVYLWGSREDAERFARHKYEGPGAYDSEPYAILEVRLPDNITPVRRKITNPEAAKAGWKYEYLVKKRIPRGCLKIVFMEEIDTESFRRFKKQLKKAGLLD